MATSLFLFLGVISRFIPHAPNFTPIGALVLHSSKKKVWVGVILAVAIMIISDMLLGFSFASIFVYLGMASYALFGKLLKSKFGIVTAPVLGSISFFLISNFGVWLGPWYEPTLTGLIKCYSLALPFFQNTLLSNIVFTVAVFSIAKIYKKITEGRALWQPNCQKVTLNKK